MANHKRVKECEREGGGRTGGSGQWGRGRGDAVVCGVQKRVSNCAEMQGGWRIHVANGRGDGGTNKGRGLGCGGNGRSAQ